MCSNSFISLTNRIGTEKSEMNQIVLDDEESLLEIEHIADEEVDHIGPLLLVVDVGIATDIDASTCVASLFDILLFPNEWRTELLLEERAARNHLFPEIFELLVLLRIDLHGNHSHLVVDIETEVETLDASAVGNPLDGTSVLTWKTASLAFELMPKSLSYIECFLLSVHDYSNW